MFRKATISILLLSIVVMVWASPFAWATPFRLGNDEEAQAQVQQSLEVKLTALQTRWKEYEAKGKKPPKHLHTAANRIRGRLCKDGKTQHCPREVLIAREVDLDKLAYAVAVAETSNCTKGTGVSKNNCHGIFGNNNGKWGPRTFQTHEESFYEFKKLWLRKYGDRFPTIEDARRYSGGEGHSWLERVTIAYNRKEQK